MTTADPKKRKGPKAWVCLAAVIASSISIAALTRLFALIWSDVPADPAFVEKLKSAKHYQSTFPASRQTVDLYRKSTLRHAALNAIGMELRDVAPMASGEPEIVFAMLSHLGGFGEIIWVDQWTNFPIKLPATSNPRELDVPRRDAVRAALDALEASGACLIKAGDHRCLVAKASEKEKYEAAISALGWLNGKPAPWDTEDKANKSRAEPDGAANGSQPMRSETNRASSAAGSRR